MHIKVMNSLGDSVYHRPFVRAFASSIDTKWPDLFSDLKFRDFDGEKPRSPGYTSKNLALCNITRAIGRFFPDPDPFVFDLPEFPKPGGRYAVIRPPTLRRDFYAPARNPLMEYVSQSVEILKSRGIETIGVGNIGDNELFHGKHPDVDVEHWNGLKIPELMGLLSGAEVIIAGPGYTVPVAMAYKVPHVIIYGGAAKWNRLAKLTDPRVSHKLAVVEPDDFCRVCPTVEHDCNKTISDFERKFNNALDRAMSM